MLRSTEGASRSTHDRMPPSLPMPDDRSRPVIKSGWWARLRGPVGSLVLHLLPLLLLIDWPMSPPPETEPIPVQLVFEPPPKATPPPPRTAAKTHSAAAARPPRLGGSRRPRGERGRQAEGRPAASGRQTGQDRNAAGRDKAAREAAADRGDAPPPLPPAKPDAPKPDPVPKPPPKPTPAAHQVPRRVEEPANLAPRRAQIPRARGDPRRVPRLYAFADPAALQSAAARRCSATAAA